MSRIDDRGWKGCQGQAQRRTRRVCAASLGILAAAALAVPAIANTVNDPPAAPHSIISFPQRDFVSAAGFQPSDSVTVSVLRNGVTIGTSEPVTPQDDPKTPGFDGIVEVNHPGGACWQTTTPDILPGDAIRTTVQGAGDEDQTTTAAVTADAPASPAPGTIVVTGSAQDSSGKQLPGAQIEQRLVSGGDLFARNNKRTLRAGAGAGGGDGDGTLVYDSATSTDFTATYTGLSDADVARALAAESRTLWLGVDPGSGQEGTIYEHGAAGGPTPPCTAPQAVDGVTGSDHVFDGKPTVNVLNAGSDLGLAGLARAEATAVRVKLKDPGGVTTSTVDATLSGAANGQTWTATIPAAAVAGLADGTLTAQATFDTPGGPIPGSSLTLRKDTVTPGDPGATPGPGTYRSTQAVSLQSADPAADVHYTVDGSAPSPASRVAPAQISVTSSLTITAVAVDPAGNASATRSFAYVIETPAASTGGSGGGAAPAATVVRIPAPPPSGGTVAGSPRPKLALASLRTAARMSQSTARKRGLRLTMGLPTGTEIVRIQVYRKTAKGLTLLSDGYRAPSAAGVYRVSQSHAQLRRLLKRGSYEVRVTPGYAKNDLGVTRRVAFKIV